MAATNEPMGEEREGMKELLMDDNLSLSPRWVLYWYGNQALLCDENDEFAYVEINETEFEVINAINLLHKVEDVWNHLCIEYSMSECDEEIEILKDYLSQLIKKGILCRGTGSKPIYGEKGKYYPLYVSVELTNCCNFKCSHCYKEADITNDFIDESRVVSFLKKIIHKIHGVTFTGGEATLHPAFSSIVNELPLNCIALLSNGSYLSKIPSETLSRLGHIQISLYGCSEEEYVTFAKSNHFMDVINGIRKVVNLGLSHDVAIILRPSNINLLEQYMQILSDCGVKNVRFGLTTEIGRNINGAWSLDEAQCITVSKAIDELEHSFPEIAIEDFRWQVDFGIPPLPEKSNYSMKCGGGKYTIIVSESGFVRPCHLLPSHCFQSVTMEQYLKHILEGETVSFEKGVNDCAKYMKTMGKTLDSICPHGFI